MKKCPQCGKAVPENFPNCPSCGAVVDASNSNLPEGESKNKNFVPFYQHVKKFKGFHCFSAYFWKLMYIIGVMAMLAAIVMVPFIPTVSDVEFELMSMDFTFANLTSIFKICLGAYETFSANPSDFNALANIALVVVFVLLLVPAILWAVVKFIRCFILVLFAGAKKKRVVIESLAKVQKREYDFGMLNVDRLYFYSLFVVIFIYACCTLVPLLNSFEATQAIAATIASYGKALEPFTADPFMNFGSLCIWASVGLSTLLGIFFLIVRGIVKGKVKKHFGLKK